LFVWHKTITVKMSLVVKFYYWLFALLCECKMSTVCLSTTFNAATSIKLRRVHIAFSSDRLILQFTRQADSKSSGAKRLVKEF